MAATLSLLHRSPLHFLKLSPSAITRANQSKLWGKCLNVTNFGEQRHKRSSNAAQTKHKQRDLRGLNTLLGGMQYQQAYLWRALRQA